MTETWRDVKWIYDDRVGVVFTRVDGRTKIICAVPEGDCQDEIGRAIAHAWNVDLAATQWSRELFNVDDSAKTLES